MVILFNCPKVHNAKMLQSNGEMMKKKIFPQFGHVMLTPVEYSKTCEQFDDADDRIRRLDEYLEMHRNKSYSNHYLTILNWARRNGDKPQEREKTTAEMIAELDWSKYDGSQTV